VEGRRKLLDVRIMWRDPDAEPLARELARLIQDFLASRGIPSRASSIYPNRSKGARIYVRVYESRRVSRAREAGWGRA